MTASPIWFGSENRPLLGWIHLPEHAIGGVVVCQPIGYESHAGYRAFYALAERLEAAGFVVLRFDYTGMGDAAGHVSEVNAVDTWIEDIQRAVAIVRATGVAKIGLVGLRVGALLAAEAAATDSIDALVLWDPCESGRSYLREQRMLGAAVGTIAEPWGPPSPNDVDIIGFRLPRGLGQSLSALDLGAHTEKLPERLLVLARPDRPLSAKLRARLEAGGAEFDASPEQQQFTESWVLYFPEGTVDPVANWCISALSAPPDEAVVPVLDHPTWAPLDLPAPGVTDQPILIESRGLFGMLTERTDVDHDEAPAVLFLNAASDRHIGPSRLWVDLAREWAARGARVLRLDLGGLGDSPTRPGYNRDVIYPPGGVGDVVAAAHFLCPEDPGRVVLVGVCSGGYYAAEAALPLKSKAIWAINPWVPLESRMTQHEPVPGAAEPKVVRRANRISARYMNNQRAIALVHKLIPKWAFWVFDKVGLYTYPLRAYGPLVAQGTDVHLLCGEQEAVQFLVRGDRLRKRMERTGRLRFSRVEVLDHGVWMPPGRAEIARLLTDYVTTDLDPTDLETTDLGIDAESPVRTG